jgi:hypothetical protein
MKYKLKIAGVHYDELKTHLYPGDGKEAIALALCGRLELNEITYFFVHKIHKIPYSSCKVREELYLDWETESIQSVLIEAEKNNLSVLKIHSHPTGIRNFSKTDDTSDHILFDSVFGWTLNVTHHLSAIMLSDGEVICRVINTELQFEHVSEVMIVSDDIVIYNNKNCEINEDIDVRNIQTFGEGTVKLLKQLSIAVLGCSGTGSPVIEQLARLGVGEIVLIDPKKMEFRNLNRILNTTYDDAKQGRYKVDIFSDFIQKLGFGTKITTFVSDLYDNKDAIFKVASCDAIFGCMDSTDGRHIASLISNFYLIPYFDIGVRLDADGVGGIDSINGSIHYIQPGKSSLFARRVYTSEQLKDAGELRKNHEFYELHEKEGYIKNAKTDSPAVISVNMLYASLAVNDLLARIHPYRIQKNKECSVQRFILSEPMYINDSADYVDKYFINQTGLGTVYPLLKLPEFS